MSESTLFADNATDREASIAQLQNPFGIPFTQKHLGFPGEMNPVGIGRTPLGTYAIAVRDPT